MDREFNIVTGPASCHCIWQVERAKELGYGTLCKCGAMIAKENWPLDQGTLKQAQDELIRRVRGNNSYDDLTTY